MKLPYQFAFAASFVAALSTAACTGDTGPAGPPGPPGGVDPDAPALDKAYAGAGGKDALIALSGFRITASGERMMSLEGFRPEDESISTGPFTSDTAADVAGDRLAIHYTRSVTPFAAHTDYKVIVDGNLAAIDGVESIFGVPGGALSSDRWAAIVREHRLLDPELILRDVALGTLTATDAGLALVDGELRHRLEISDAVHPISLFVDRYTGEITDLATIENDFVEGDQPLEVHYLGWRAWDGEVRFPTDVVIALADREFHVEHRDAVTTEGVLDDALFTMPAGAAPTYVAADADRGARSVEFHEAWGAIGVPLDGLQTAIDAQQIAPGVWHLRGGTHHSLVVEQASGVVVVEGPLYEARAQAIYDWIATNIPGKPVTDVIATHHHRDHTGSLRTFVARGARVIVGESSKPFWTAAFRAAHGIVPDELSATPAVATITGVAPGASLTLPDAAQPVQAIAITSSHAADMLMVYLPASHVAFTSDLLNPGIPTNPLYAGELLAAITDRGLAVDTIAGGHGLGVATMADLHTAAGQ